MRDSWRRQRTDAIDGLKIGAGRALARVVFLGLAVWFAILVLTNLCDALVSLGLMPHVAIASGNFVQVRDTVARIGIPSWGAAVFLSLAIVLEAVAAAAFVRALLRPTAARVNMAFGVALLLFGGFAIMDEICTSYALGATHRGLVVFIAALYLVARAAAPLES